MVEDQGSRYFAVVRNIPKTYHSADLRRFFSRVIEENVFSCFHYKHRPEGGQKGHSSPDTYMCVVSFAGKHARDKVVNDYSGTNWTNADGSYLKQKCSIFKVTVRTNPLVDTRSCEYATRSERKYFQRHAKSEDFQLSDLVSLSEMNPPVHIMPFGNVGTPVSVFLQFIQQCQLPASVIKKLGLVFPSTGSNRRYGNVPYVYAETEVSPAPPHGAQSPHLVGENQSDSDSDGCEDWERHEALHNDVTSQERTKERLFEEEIELKWEKGGSGLVFYTDAQYWAEQEGDFDEQNTDDWDVDMNEFYGELGDRDARDFAEICREKRLRDGRDRYHYGVLTSSQAVPQLAEAGVAANETRLGDFEKHTKGVGRKIMQSLGWSDTKPLGVRGDGLVQPLTADGRSQTERSGLGYHGQKLSHVSDVGSFVHSDFASYSGADKDRRVVKYKVLPTPTSLHSSQARRPLQRSNIAGCGATARTSLIPGEDGIVLTTKYDPPLDIDRDQGALRSQLPSALKRRPQSSPPSTASNPQTSVSKTSKLVRSSCFCSN